MIEQPDAATSLATLPPPPSGCVGWPWDVASAPLPPTMADGTPWPRITVVTPSFQQGQFLEETIRSVLLQGYPKLEYYVIDGGSRDNSVAVIEKYALWLTGWVSERDDGQTDAIAKGFTRATGDWIAWLNSDDLYQPGALAAVGQAAARHPGAIIAGNVVNFLDGTARAVEIRQGGITLPHMAAYWEGRYRWHQPGLFFPREVYQRAGGMDRALVYAMDHDLICRLLAAGAPVTYLDQALAKFRLHGTSKTVSQARKMTLETSVVAQRYWPNVAPICRRDHDAYLAGELLRLTGRQLGTPAGRRQLREDFASVGVHIPWWAWLGILLRYAQLRWARWWRWSRVERPPREEG